VTALPLPDAAAALAEVTRWYGDRGLPAQLQVVVGGAPPGLEELLTAQGWQRSAPVHAMTAEAAHVLRAATPPLPGAAPVDVRLDASPDDGWLACYRPDEAPLTEHGLQVLTRHPHVAFASVRDAGGGCRAITRVAVDGRWAGLHAVEVRPDARRQSLGTSLALAAVRWAVGEGARRVYLQVRADNDAGVALWTRLGFAVHHDYVYWTAPDARLT
jgi:ribosomal protein S18 acetylase RimI-like enzyme